MPMLTFYSEYQGDIENFTKTDNAGALYVDQQSWVAVHLLTTLVTILNHDSENNIFQHITVYW